MAESNSSAPTDSEVPGRRAVIRDLAVFQFKLAVDGVLDILLSPMSLALGIYGLIFGGAEPGRYFYRLMNLGHRTDRWINLFGAADRRVPGEPSADELIRQMEKMLRDRYEGRRGDP